MCATYTESPAIVRLENTRLDRNRSGNYEIRWTERDETGRARSRTYSCRTSDRNTAERVRAAWLDAQAAVAAPTHTTFIDVADHYLRHARRRGLNTDAARWALLNFQRFAPDLTLDDIAPTVAAYIEHRQQAGISNATIRREVATIKSALNTAIRKGFVRDWAVPHIDMPPQTQPRMHFLDANEAQRLWDLSADLIASDEALREKRIGVFNCIALDTAARTSAILGLTWDRIGSDLIDYRDSSKTLSNKRRVAVPVSARLAAIIDDWRDQCPATGPADPVLLHHGDNRKAFDRFRDRHGFPEWLTRHVLRHTWATLKLQRGASLWDVAGVLGDRVETVSAVYGHHSTHHLRTVVDL